MVTQKWLTFAAVMGLAWWFFGNLYEAVVFSPNWVIDSPAQLQRLNALFVTTSPTAYFVPITPAAVLLAWGLMLGNRQQALQSDYRKAGVLGALAMALNAFIVATLITKLFGADFASHGEALSTYATRWNVLNAVRMVLTAATAAYLFSAFRKLDRA